jgi:hypothetical protein
MSKEDKGLAREMVREEMEKNIALFRQQDVPSEIVGYGRDGVDSGKLPPGDGGRLFVPISIGARGSLSKQRARDGARAWHEAVRRNPKAFFMISLLGYDEDPREIWEIPEAARYVRWWAKYTGMDDLKTADRFFGTQSAIGNSGISVATSGMGFLMACGVFGEEGRRQILARFKPTLTN